MGQCLSVPLTAGSSTREQDIEPPDETEPEGGGSTTMRKLRRKDVEVDVSVDDTSSNQDIHICINLKLKLKKSLNKKPESIRISTSTTANVRRNSNKSEIVETSERSVSSRLRRFSQKIESRRSSHRRNSAASEGMNRHNSVRSQGSRLNWTPPTTPKPPREKISALPPKHRSSSGSRGSRRVVAVFPSNPPRTPSPHGTPTKTTRKLVSASPLSRSSSGTTPKSSRTIVSALLPKNPSRSPRGGTPRSSRTIVSAPPSNAPSLSSSPLGSVEKINVQEEGASSESTTSNYSGLKLTDHAVQPKQKVTKPKARRSVSEGSRLNWARYRNDKPMPIATTSSKIPRLISARRRSEVLTQDVSTKTESSWLDLTCHTSKGRKSKAKAASEKRTASPKLPTELPFPQSNHREEKRKAALGLPKELPFHPTNQREDSLGVLTTFPTKSKQAWKASFHRHDDTDITHASSMDQSMNDASGFTVPVDYSMSESQFCSMSESQFSEQDDFRCSVRPLTEDNPKALPFLSSMRSDPSIAVNEHVRSLSSIELRKKKVQTLVDNALDQFSATSSSNGQSGKDLVGCVQSTGNISNKAMAGAAISSRACKSDSALLPPRDAKNRAPRDHLARLRKEPWNPHRVPSFSV